MSKSEEKSGKVEVDSGASASRTSSGPLRTTTTEVTEEADVTLSRQEKKDQRIEANLKAAEAWNKQVEADIAAKQEAMDAQSPA